MFLRVGASARLDCLVTTPVAQTNFRWEMPSAGVYDEVRIGPGYVAIPNVAIALTGRYVCIASTEAGETKVEFTVIVECKLIRGVVFLDSVSLSR